MDRDWEKHGLSASVQHQLWETLKHHPKGLTVSEITKELGKQSEDSKVHCLPSFVFHHRAVSTHLHQFALLTQSNLSLHTTTS